MGRLLFGAEGGGDGGGVEPSDWSPVANHDEDGKAPSLDRQGPGKSDGIVLTVKKKKTRTPEGVHRDFNTVTNYGGDPLEVAVGMGEHSESSHEYMYAPGLSPLAAILFTGGRGRFAARKFWIDPEGKFLEFDELDEHDQALLDSSVSFAGLTGSEAIEDAMDQGWVRGGIEGGEMYLQFASDVSKVPAALKAIPQELLFVSNLTVQLGVPVSEFIAIPVDEGEDAADAWAKRKSPRKRIRAAVNTFGNLVTPDKYWVTPAGELLDVHDYTADGDGEHDEALQSYLAENNIESEGDTGEDLRAWALQQGWARVGYGDDFVYVQVDSLARLPKVLRVLDAPAAKTLYVDDLNYASTEVPVDEGETLEQAWTRRHSIRKRVKGELAQTYQDNLSNVQPQDPPGYPDRIEDSNNTPRRPGQRGDKNVQLDRLPGDKSYPSGSPEPPNAADIGMGNMLYPLAGILFTSAQFSQEELEGQGLRFENNRPYQDGKGRICVWKGQSNEMVGELSYKDVEESKWAIEPVSAWVADDYKRKGIATAMYDMAEKFSDKSMSPSASRSDEAESFWENRGLGKGRVPVAASIRADEKTVDFTDPESGLNFKYIWDSEVNRLPSHVQIVMEDPSEPEGKRHLPTLEIELGPQGWEVPQGGTSAQMGAVDIAMANLPQVLKNVGDRVAKKFQVQEKDDGQKHSRYNVLEDPALEAVTGLTPEEKIFTTITDWDGDSFYVDLSRVDQATMKILKQHPRSDPKRNKYFSWDLVSKADKAELAKKDVKTRGNTALDLDQDSLIVERLPAWKQIEPQVQRSRKENQES